MRAVRTDSNVRTGNSRDREIDLSGVDRGGWVMRALQMAIHNFRTNARIAYGPRTPKSDSDGGAVAGYCIRAAGDERYTVL